MSHLGGIGRGQPLDFRNVQQSFGDGGDGEVNDMSDGDSESSAEVTTYTTADEDSEPGGSRCSKNYPEQKNMILASFGSKWHLDLADRRDQKKRDPNPTYQQMESLCKCEEETMGQIESKSDTEAAPLLKREEEDGISVAEHVAQTGIADNKQAKEEEDAVDEEHEHPLLHTQQPPVEERPNYFDQNELPGSAALCVLPFKFDCQLAHGSATATISQFDDVRQVYDQVAQKFGPQLCREDVLYCTVNTPKLDMEKLLSASLDRDDMIFAHVRGQRKEVSVAKTEPSLGLTITDNGDGRAFVKRVRYGSICDRLYPAVKVGDCFESIDGVSMLGKRHLAVSQRLRNIPVGSQFELRLVEPQQTEFSHVAPPRRRKTTASRKPHGSYSRLFDEDEDGFKTVRFSHDGGKASLVGAKPAAELIGQLNKHMEDYLGVSDDDLAWRLLEMSAELRNSFQLIDAIKQSDLAVFDIPDDMIIDMWGVISDYRRQRGPAVEQTGRNNK